MAPTKNEATPEKADKKAAKKADKAEKPAKQRKLTEAEKQATLMDAIKCLRIRAHYFLPPNHCVR